MDGFVELQDLASHVLGGGVVAANDEWFADKENLVLPAAPVFDPNHFGPKGKIMDGWETRRRRKPGVDWAIVRLGAPGVIRGVVVDTTHFRGNYPEFVTIEAAAAEGYPSPDELQSEDVDWFEIVGRSPLQGDTRNLFEVIDPRRFTHVRMTIHPDGGVARLRVHGEVVPDPRLLDTSALDLAAQDTGARVVDCSNKFFSSASNVTAPGLPAHMGEGWETSRRRDDGYDWVQIELAQQGLLTQIELDTRFFLGNAPGEIRLRGADVSTGDDEEWFDILGRIRVQPDTRHRFVVDSAQPVTHVRLEAFPDGGLARLRLWGTLTELGRDRVQRRWLETLPTRVAESVKAGNGVLATNVIGEKH